MIQEVYLSNSWQNKQTEQQYFQHFKNWPCLQVTIAQTTSLKMANFKSSSFIENITGILKSFFQDYSKVQTPFLSEVMISSY